MTLTEPAVIVTGRLVRLREKREEDARQDYEWRTDPELATYDATRPMTMSFRSYLRTYREELEHPTRYRRSLVIEDLESGRHIGNVMYYGYEDELNQAELGITIGDRAFWSRGCGTDAVRCMLRHVFRDREMQRVYLHTLQWNERAKHAFHSAGFRPVRPVHRGGYDFILMDIRAEEFEAAERAESDTR